MSRVEDSVELSPVIPDKRAASDRRTFTWRTVLFGFAFSRRHNHRRLADQQVLFLDWHHPWLFFLSVGIMLLSCADAFLTLRLMEHGMIEANPIMAATMGMGTPTFAVTKILMTGTSILILVFLAKTHFMNRVRTGLLLTIFFSIYCCLVCYEIVHLLAAH